ncbi:MAG: hypothetical protein OXU63_03725 [Acidobacteriota bacterium]|nr:hypothetical protein [Acidobacteriota bacterium]
MKASAAVAPEVVAPVVERVTAQVEEAPAVKVPAAEATFEAA